VIAMRDNDEIGDDAFHAMEEELDWLEMAAGEAPEVEQRAGPDTEVRRPGQGW
jgi:hypothetical protein